MSDRLAAGSAVAARLCAAAASVVLVAGCADESDSGTFVAAPDGYVFSDPTWSASADAVVAATHPRRFELDEKGTEKGRFGLSTIDLQTQAVRAIDLPDEDGCVRTEQLFPAALGDGRVAFVQRCIGTAREPAEAASLRVWDPRTRGTSELIPARLHASTYRLGFSGDGRVGVVVRGGAQASSLARIERFGLSRVNVDVAEVLEAKPSPGGERLALVVIAHPAASRSTRQTLLLTDREGEIVGTLLVAREIRPPAWSPDGATLAIVCEPMEGPSGIWLVGLDGTRTLVKAGRHYDTVAWLPDGRLVATVGSFEDDGRVEAGLDVLELPDP